MSYDGATAHQPGQQRKTLFQKNKRESYVTAICSDNVYRTTFFKWGLEIGRAYVKNVNIPSNYIGGSNICIIISDFLMCNLGY